MYEHIIFFTLVDVIAMSMKMQYIEKHSTNALFKDYEYPVKI